MNLKNFIGAMLVGLIFFTNNFASAYDLPNVEIEKQKKSVEKVQQEEKKFFKSDWTAEKIFEQKIKTLLAEKNLPASSAERISQDKNLIFVGIYKGNFYFLDRYSIKIKKKSADKKSWQQRIYPVGEKIYSKNLKATVQNFYTDTKKIFNSSRKKNNLDKIENLEDKNFLKECFEVGYYHAFGEEFIFAE